MNKPNTTDQARQDEERSLSRYAEVMTIIASVFAVVAAFVADQRNVQIAAVAGGAAMIVVTAHVFRPLGIGNRGLAAVGAVVLIMAGIVSIALWPSPTETPMAEDTTATDPADGTEAAGGDADGDGEADSEMDPEPPMAARCLDDVESFVAVYQQVGRNPVVRSDLPAVDQLAGMDPDVAGGHLVVVDPDQTMIEVHSINGEADVNGEPDVQIRSFTPTVAEPTIAADGSLAVAVQRTSDGTRLVYWHLPTGETGVLLDPSEEVASPSLSADASRIAWVQGPGAESNIRVGQVAGFAVTETAVVNGSDPDLNDDGTQLLYTDGYGDNTAVYTAELDGSETRRMSDPSASADDRDPSWVPGCDAAIFTRTDDDGTDLWLTDGTTDSLFRTLTGVQTSPSVVRTGAG